MRELMFPGLLVIVLLAGCSSTPPKPERPPYDSVPPAVVGTTVAAGSMMSLREPETVRTYQTGRYIDPWNPNMMHEAGQIYVLAESSVWNTRPNMPPGSARNNQVLNIPGPVTAQLQVHAGVMKQGIESLRQVRTDYANARKSLEESRNTLAAEVKTVAETKKELARMKERYDELVKKMSQLESRQTEENSRRSGKNVERQSIDFEVKTK